MPIVGLDLGTHGFRAVEMEEQKGQLTLRKYGYYEDARLNIHTSAQPDLDAYSQALKEFFNEIGFTTPQVVVPLPESEVFTRVIQLPHMSEKELKSSITYEAEQYIPIPLKEINFDFQILDPDDTNKDKMNVLIVAAKHTVLNKYIEILKKAGLRPKALEPETLSVNRVLGDTAKNPSASIILDIGTLDSQIIVSHKGFVRFTRSVAVGGDSFTKAIEQKLNFDFAQAEEYKKTYGLDKSKADGKVYEAVKPVFDQVLNEVKRSKVFYTTHNPDVSINRLIVSGGSALMPGILYYVANNLDTEVEMANPWRNVEFIKALDSKKEKLNETGPLYATAVGLALKDLNGD